MAGVGGEPTGAAWAGGGLVARLVAGAASIAAPAELIRCTEECTPAAASLGRGNGEVMEVTLHGGMDATAVEAMPAAASAGAGMARSC
mmetsp:Transcript_16253/g.47499  ORF Transcript_16253/g.47499 Transcript_16253/m.47499 type:complete len:88 (-) Transcript_16253:560-823(-)